MWLRRRGPVAVLVALAVAGGTVAGAPARAADPPRTTTVIQAAPADERSAPLTVLLVGVGAVVGVIVGLLPALVVATLLGYLPPPRRRRSRAGVLVEPPRAPPEAAGFAPAPVATPGVVALAPAEEPLPDAPPVSPIAVLAHARHQSVYDAAYAAQLERVEALRAAIGDRRRDRPEPPSE